MTTSTSRLDALELKKQPKTSAEIEEVLSFFKAFKKLTKLTTSEKNELAKNIQEVEQLLNMAKLFGVL